MSKVYTLSLLFALCGCALMQAGFQLFSSLRPTVIKVMFLTHAFAQLIPAFIIAVRNEGPASDEFLLHNAISTVLIPIGGLLAMLAFPVRNEVSLFHAPLDSGMEVRSSFARFYVAYALFCFILFISYISTVPVIPVYDLFFGLREFSILDRRAASDAGQIFGFGFVFFMPLLFLLSMIGAKYFTSGLLRWIAAGGVTISLLYNAWPGNKTPVATIFLMAFFVMIIRRRETKRLVSATVPHPRSQRRLQRRRTISVIVLALLTIGYPVYVYMALPVGRLGLEYIVIAVFERIFFKPAVNSYTAFTMFLDGQYTYFSDISKVASVFGLDYVNLSRAVARFRGGHELTNAPPAAIGNFYAQGGTLAVFIGVTIAAMMFKATENLLSNSRPKVPLTIALYAMLIFGSFRFSWANFHNLLFSELFMPMALILLAWTFFRGGRAVSPRRVVRGPDEEALSSRAHHSHP